MNINVVNVPKQEEYEKFKQLCPNAREITYEDGSKSLVVEKDGVELFKLDFIKKGQLSERDIFVVKNWGLNPNNVEQIVEAYNAFMPDKIDLSKKAEEEKSYYKVSGGGLDYAKGLISEIKRLNPNVQIDGQWIDRNYRHEQITIISSIPLEQLNMPTGYYGNALGRTIFSESQEEYSQNLTGDFLNFNVSQAHTNEFANALREFNPNVSISIEYDEENKVGKINSSVPLDKLNYPTGYYGGIGLDKDGYVAYLKDRVIDYKIGYELDGMDSSKQYTENTQRYFGSVSYRKMQEKKNTTETPIVETPVVETPVEKQESGIQIQPTKQEPQEELARMARENRKFTILQRERAMSDAQKAKNRSAIMAGICILGAAVATYFNGQDINTVLQHELNAIYSWEALGQYLQDLGPMTTMLAAGAGAFVAKYFKNSRKFKQAQNEFIDFNASLENTQTLGGNENAKSR